jgi:transcriptional regulator with XRE-family HTH domain
MENYRRIFGQNVRDAREALQLSQEELGHEIDIDRTYISGIERGVRNPSLDVIVKIAQRLKTTPAALLTRPAQRRLSGSA